MCQVSEAGSCVSKHILSLLQCLGCRYYLTYCNIPTLLLYQLYVPSARVLTACGTKYAMYVLGPTSRKP